MEVPAYEIVLGLKFTRKWIKNKYPSFFEYLLSTYPDLTWGEKLYWYYNNIQSHPICICGKKLNFLDPHKGYRKYCSTGCAWKTDDYKMNIKKTLNGKYGVDNVFKNKKIQEKQHKTVFEKYGVENISMNPDIKEKRKKTCIRKYGVTNPGLLNSADIINNEEPHKLYKYKCPHNNCNKCEEKEYECDRNLHNSRKNFGQELCTKLLPRVNIFNKNTSLEIFVKLLLNEHNIIFIENDRIILDGKELDIYIPDKKLAIECNGCYWHSTKKKDKYYHYEKYKLCKEKGIQLLTFWEDQVLNTPDIVKSIILSKLNIYDTKIYARKCVIREVNTGICRSFLNQFHLQGAVNGSVKIGLYYNDELISIMVFGKGRISVGGDTGWELYRYCCKTGTHIIGGASKMFKYFIKNFKPKTISSYSSHDISDGNLYRMLGFNIEREIMTSYWYIDKKILRRYHRYSFRKSRLVELGYDGAKTESTITKEMGLFKIFDTGQTKYKYEL